MIITCENIYDTSVAIVLPCLTRQRLVTDMSFEKIRNVEHFLYATCDICNISICLLDRQEPPM